jgi:hypothetical protein
MNTMKTHLLAAAALSAMGPARAGAVLNFDASQVEPDTGFEIVPAGWYNVLIDESDMKPTKDGSGAYLQIRFNIIDGQYANRKIFARLNLRNANQQTVEIAMRQLSAIGHAVGVLQIQDSSQLHGIPLKVKVKVRRDTTGQYEDQNDITSYKNINEQVDMPGGPAADGGAPQGGISVPAGFGQPQGQAIPAGPAGQPQQPWAQPPAQQAGFGGGQQPQVQQQPWAPPQGQQQPPVQQQPQPQQPQQQPDQSQQAWQQPQGQQQPWQQPQGDPSQAQQPAQQPVQQVQQPVQQQQQPQQAQQPQQGGQMPPWAQPQG